MGPPGDAMPFAGYSAMAWGSIRPRLLRAIGEMWKNMVPMDCESIRREETPPPPRVVGIPGA